MTSREYSSGRRYVGSCLVCLLAMSGISAGDSTLVNLLQDVRGADARRYGAVDSAGNTLASMSVVAVEGLPYKYVGLYHAAQPAGGGFRFAVHVGTSSDLINWTHESLLIDNADMPYIYEARNAFDPMDTKYLVAHEQWIGPGPASTSPARLGFRLYDSISDLLSGTVESSFVLPSGVQVSAADLEGTPNIYEASFTDDGGAIRLDAAVGFHYFDTGPSQRDMQGQGILTFEDGNWSWSGASAVSLNNALTATGATGNLGQRDAFDFRGAKFNIFEGNIQPPPGVPTDFGAWRLWKYDWGPSEIGPFPSGSGQLTPIVPSTDGGSTAFGNAFAQVLPSPNGNGEVLFGNYFLFSEGAAPGEGGALVFYHELAPVSPSNQLLNGDFENSNGETPPFPASWFRSAAGVAYIQDDDSDGTGERSVALVTDGSIKPDWRHPAFEVDGGEDLLWAFDFKFQNGAVGEVWALLRYFSDADGQSFIGQELVRLTGVEHPAGEWQTFASIATVPPAAQSADLWFPTAFAPFSGEWRLDDVGVYEANQILSGDYDLNGVVNSDDWIVWKSTLGSTLNRMADGNRDGAVNLADYTIWRDHLGLQGGQVFPGAGVTLAVSEPLAVGLMLASVALGLPWIGIW